MKNGRHTSVAWLRVNPRQVRSLNPNTTPCIPLRPSAGLISRTTPPGNSPSPQTPRRIRSSCASGSWSLRIRLDQMPETVLPVEFLFRMEVELDSLGGLRGGPPLRYQAETRSASPNAPLPG